MLSDAPITPTIPAIDIERAKKFYGETLGLKELPGMETDSAIFECGSGTRLYVYQRPPSHAEHTLAGFEVKNLDAEMTDLRGRGVVFEEYDFPGLKTVNGVATMGDSKGAWFKDSEGNILAINQRT